MCFALCSTYIVERMAGVVTIDGVFRHIHQKQLHWCREVAENLGSGVDHGMDYYERLFHMSELCGTYITMSARIDIHP